MATTKYVRKTGNDSNGGTNPTTDAKLTINGASGGLSVLSGGDTLDIGDGTYTEGIDYNKVPSGGGIGFETIIKATNRGAVILNGADSFASSVIAIYDTNFFILDGLDIDCADIRLTGILIGADSGGPASHNGIVRYCKVHNVLDSTGACISFNDGTDTGLAKCHDMKIQHCELYDVVGGVPQGAHGVYLHVYNTIVEDCHIHDISGWGIHQYTSNLGSPVGNLNNNIVRRNLIHDCGRSGIMLGGNYDSSGATGSTAYNNIVYNCGTIDSTKGNIYCLNGHDCTFYHNTVYGNAGHAAHTENSQLTLYKNNIWYNNGTNDNSDTDGSTGTVTSNNTTTNPVFVNAGAADFHLNAASGPAYQAGVDLTGIVDDDYDRKPRTSTPDNGAYQFVTPSVPKHLPLRPAP